MVDPYDSGDDQGPYALLDAAEHTVQPQALLTDALEFTGFDLASARRSASSPQPMPAVFLDDELETEDQDAITALNEEIELVRSAKSKLRRASDQGKSHAIMTQDEADALERHRQEKQETLWTKSPVPPDRSNSVAQLRVNKTRRKESERRVVSERSRKPMAPRSSNSPALGSSQGSRDVSPYSAFQRPPQRVPGSFDEPRSVSFDRAGGSPHAYQPRSYSKPTNMRSASAPKTHEIYNSAGTSPLPRARAASSYQRSRHADDHQLPDTARRNVSGPEYAYSGRRNVSGPPEYAYTSRRAPQSPVLETIASPVRETVDYPAAMTPGYWASRSTDNVSPTDGVEQRRVKRVPLPNDRKGKRRDRSE